MVILNNLTMGFSQRTLFKDVSLSIFKNEKIGLTGPNGAGKTTLFSIIRGEMEPVAGFVQVQKNIHVGYLPQEAHFASTKTVMEEITEGDERIAALMEEKRKIEDAGKADSPRYGDVVAQLEGMGIYDLEHTAEKILVGLGFKETDFHRPVAELSGGWQMRVLLAKLLTCPFDLLLLDEPTNHLDLEATLWLKDFLKNYDGAFVLISHDRVLLNEVTNYTIILEGSRMTKLRGNYETYEEQKGIQKKTLEKQQKVIEKKRDQLERFAQRFHAQPNRASAVRNKRKMLERLEQVDVPQEHKSIGEFEFSGVRQGGYVVARAGKIGKSYGERRVYQDLDLEIIRGQKICLVGPNGAGKSTLLKMLAGVLPPDAGTVQYGHEVSVGYFSQKRLDVLDPNRNVLDELMVCAQQGTPALKARGLLGLFNFHGDDVFKQVKVLSGGEKSRLILAKLLINPPNFMCLDEPTTHLDVDGVKALTMAFQEFGGTLCFISHDLYFIKEIATTIVETQNGQLKTYLGGLDYYLEKRREQAAQDQHVSAKADADRKKKEKSAKSHDTAMPPHLKALHDRHQQALKRVKEIKNTIKELEQERKDLETESYIKGRSLSEAFGRDPATLKEYGQRLKAIQARLREIESTLKKLEEEKERIEKA
ncbi:MAG: ATP-binding cassette domain-containing protein [Candidatus Omnitrophica bacterium]|nr:ATP-binding cassette domain-containing protein [Candidatus Omnitrophota bacterium]